VPRHRTPKIEHPAVGYETQNLDNGLGRQLMRYFGGKAGLLDAVFNGSWTEVIGRVSEEIPPATPAHDAILRMLSIRMEAFGRDHDIAVIFLFDGRGRHDARSIAGRAAWTAESFRRRRGAKDVSGDHRRRVGMRR
jgi:hypothetical protein